MALPSAVVRLTLPPAVAKGKDTDKDLLKSVNVLRDGTQRYANSLADGVDAILKGGVVARVQTWAITTTQQWAVPAGCLLLNRRAYGGGGGGGACASAAANNGSAGSGGAAGARAEDWLSQPAAGTQFQITIGNKGAGGAAGANNGASGGTTSIDQSLIAPGGAGGQHEIASATGSVLGGGQAATGAVGFLTGAGEQGGFSIQVPGTSGIFVQSGAGGNSDCGRGGPSVGGFSNPGASGTGFSSGGSGATCYNTAAATKGGDGTQGLVVLIGFMEA